MKITKPINLHKWIEEHKDLLKPPVGNQVIWKDADFIVMVVGGPNARSDFHINNTEEIFYQLKGDICLRVYNEDHFENILIKEGEIFLLPGRVPHSPIRGENTIGLVVERKRQSHERDGFSWYCEKCQSLLYSEYAYIHDIVAQLPIIFDHYYGSEKNRTCSNCGYVNPDKPK